MLDIQNPGSSAAAESQDFALFLHVIQDCRRRQVEVRMGTRMGIEIGKYTAYLNSHEKYSCETTESSWMAVSASTRACRDSTSEDSKSPFSAASIDAFVFWVALKAMDAISSRTSTSGRESTNSTRLRNVSTVRLKNCACTALARISNSQSEIPSSRGLAACNATRFPPASTCSAPSATDSFAGNESQDRRLEIQPEVTVSASHEVKLNWGLSEPVWFSQAAIATAPKPCRAKECCA
mmetsp:Transcript_51812/g.121457  ORF Transcript_51812/g.121457 Transcript_51812/m.121457 type:complete len:237 (+) Transcript_51812:131-841(+)